MLAAATYFWQTLRNALIFKCVRFEAVDVDPTRWLVAYLSGGAISGVGPVTAQRIVDGLGEQVTH